MNRNIVILIVVGIVLFLVFVAPLLPFVLSGYGGLSSKIDSCTWDYDPESDDPHIQYDVTDTYAVINPDNFGDIGTTDLRFEIGQPQFRTTESTYYNEIKETLDNGDTLKRTWEVRIAYFDMGVTARTAGGGVGAIGGVECTIEISENDFNVFQGADEVKAYILEIVTKEPADVSDPAFVEVSPTAGGYSFDMEAIGTDPIPDWMSDSGYQEILSDLEIVQFSLRVVRAQPYYVPFVVRAEQQGTWYLEIRALVFGFWEVLSPYTPWVPGDVWAGFFPFLDDIFLGLQLIIGAIFGLIVTVAIMRLPIPPMAKVVILGVVWILVFVAFGGVALFGG